MVARPRPRGGDGRVRITDLHQDDEGFWTARVTVDGSTLAVAPRFGSWRVLTTGPGWRECPPAVAERLQAKVRPLERKRRREQEVQAQAG